MKRLPLLCIIALLLTATLQTWGQAVLISRWNFVNASGDWGPNPKNADSTNANVTVVGLTRGNGISVGTGLAAGNAWGAVGFADGLASAAQSVDTAIARENFVTFKVKANSGYSLSLSEVAAYNLRRSGTGPATTLWQYSLDNVNFTNIGAPYTLTFTQASGNSMNAINLDTIAALQNVPSVTTITFRVVSWNASGDGGTWYFNAGPSNQNLTINGTVTSTPLPLDLLSFTGKKEATVNHLEWVTAQEKNVSHFELERGSNGHSFAKVAEVKAAGDSRDNNKYSYDDASAGGNAYYRLKMVDKDGSTNYSDVVVVRNGTLASSIRVYPNPAGNSLFVDGVEGTVAYRITDVMGKTVATGNINTKATAVNVSGLTSGVYFLSVKERPGESVRFVKQ